MQACLQNFRGQVRGYTVRLLFAEKAFPFRSLESLKSLGRLDFDVYIQGARIFRDFDISKEEDSVERAITRSFTANVTENHLEIHLFWACKGTSGTPEEDFRQTVSGILLGNHKEKSHTAV
ncbi:hypothetical protein V6N13_084285 [Hibiscus sabdariffa]|uniref:Malectin domain-containing protein n=1 Tax=Hibiscus sabdariffa TaxID=183260 RepID=A0ABR2T0K7_9ROSI